MGVLLGEPRGSTRDPKKTMKSPKSREVKRAAPPGSLDYCPKPAGTKNDGNNNVNCDITTVLCNNMEQLHIMSSLMTSNINTQKLSNISVSARSGDTDNGNETHETELTTELTGKLSALHLIDTAHKPDNSDNVAPSETPEEITTAKSSGSESDSEGEGSEDKLCSRSPARYNSRDEHRSAPYKICSRNLTCGGGMLFATPPGIGTSEETINLEQYLVHNIVEDTERDSPPLLESQVSPIGSIVSMHEVLEHLSNPDFCEQFIGNIRQGAFDGLGEDFRPSQIPQSVEHVNQSLMLSPAASDQSTSPVGSPHWQESQGLPHWQESHGSPQQVVPGSNWDRRESSSLQSNSSSSPTRTSPSCSPSLSPYNPYSPYSPYSTHESSSSLDDLELLKDLIPFDDPAPVDFPLPIGCHGSGEYGDTYSPGLPSPPVPPQTSSLYQVVNQPSKSPQNSLGTHAVRYTPIITQETNILPNGCNVPNIQDSSSLRTQATYVVPRATTVGLLIQLPAQTSQSRPANRLVPIRPAPKLIVVPPESRPAIPSKELLLQRLDRQKKREAWVRVSMKSNEELVSGEAKDGDTILMILVSQQHPGFLELLYALVERMRRIPGALDAKNKCGQTALYVACISQHKEPLVARYIAENLLSLGVNIAEQKYEGGLSLIQCVQQRGNSHAEVLKELLSLKDVTGKLVFSH